jgi:hypothetical protein
MTSSHLDRSAAIAQAMRHDGSVVSRCSVDEPSRGDSRRRVRYGDPKVADAPCGAVPVQLKGSGSATAEDGADAVLARFASGTLILRCLDWA